MLVVGGLDGTDARNRMLIRFLLISSLTFIVPFLFRFVILRLPFLLIQHMVLPVAYSVGVDAREIISILYVSPRGV